MGMSNFLQQCAEKVLAQHGNNLSRVLVLMPNQRSCTFFRNHLQSLSEQPVFAPEIVTLQNHLLQQSELVIAENIELLTDLYACHQSIGGTQTLDEFIGTAAVMLEDFDELDLHLVNARLFFKNLKMLQSMKTWEPGSEPSEYKLKYRRFWEEFGLLYAALRERLLHKGKGYRGMILRNVAENLSSLSWSDYTAVYFIGFSGLNKTDEAVMKHLQLEKQATFFWDADRFYVNDEMQEAGHFFRKYREVFKIGAKDLKEDLVNAPREIQIVGAAKNLGQVKVVADVLQNKLKLDKETALDTVIVVPDEKLLSPLIAHLPHNIETLNLTMGLNIAGSSSANWLEVFFRIYEKSGRFTTKEGVQRFYYRDVFELLRHSFFHLLFPAAKTEVFVSRMKKQNRILISRPELVTEFGEEVTALFFEGDKAENYALFLAEVTGSVLSKLVPKVRKGESRWAAEVEILHRLLNIITATQTIFKTGNDVSIKTFIALLRSNFQTERVALEGDPVQGLQIMGLQETRGLQFKNVIVLSANEGILPQGKTQRSYIPYELRREFLTTHKERDAITAYLFYRLLQGAENVYLLYNTEPDELGGGEKSRFILQLQQELNANNSRTTITDSIFAVDPPAALGEQSISIQKEEAILQKLYSIISDSGLSPSALNTYINCTLQYYFRYIAGIREQDDMEESLEASTIGSAVHHALEKIYEPLVGKPVTAAYIAAQSADKARIEYLVREHLSARFDNESLSRGRNLLLYRVCVKLVVEFLKYEERFLNELSENGSHMELVMQEDKLRAGLLVNGKEVFMSGRVDRVEKVDGVVQIADYKTTSYKQVPIMDDDKWEQLMHDPKYAKPLQLLVYAWMYYKINGTATLPLRSGIYWLRKSDKMLETLRTGKDNDLLTEADILRFEEKLKTVLEEMTNPEVPFTKTEDTDRCKYCEFAKICGRD
jgi:hypothetical protein